MRSSENNIIIKHNKLANHNAQYIKTQDNKMQYNTMKTVLDNTMQTVQDNTILMKSDQSV